MEFGDGKIWHVYKEKKGKRGTENCLIKNRSEYLG